MKINPIIGNSTRCLIEEIKEKETDNGIIIPFKKESPFKQGYIVSITPNTDAQIKVGDKVLFEYASCKKIEVEGKELLSTKEENIWAIL